MPNEPSHTQTRPPREAGSNPVKAAALVTAGIFLSRFIGLIRQRVLAYYFGTSAFADILGAAFRVGNITQNLLGEGTLSASFIPIYAKLRGEGKDEKARAFALSSLGLLAAAVVVLSGVGVLIAPWLSFAVAAGFDAEKLAVTTRIVRILFPMTGFLVLSAWGLGVLNAHRRFFVPYAAPVLWSLAQIAGLVLAGSWLLMRNEALAQALAVSALAGAALQAIVLVGSSRKFVGSLKPDLNVRDPNVGEALGRLPAAIAGRGVIQISGLVDNLLVSFLGSGAIAIFNYAQTIYLLPISLLGTGEAAAALPEMARDTAERDIGQRNATLRARLGASIARIFTLTLPTMAAFALFGRELITLFFQGGKFDPADTERVMPILAAYGFALLGNAVGRVLGTTCFALGDTKTPARFALFRVIVSTVLALVLMRFFGVLGVVVGAVTAGWVEASLLARRVNTAIGGLGLQHVKAARVVALSALCSAAGFGARLLLLRLRVGALPSSVLVLGAFGAAFILGARLLKLMSLQSLLRRR